MRKLVLYRSRPIVGIDFTGVKKLVVPNQSLTLAQILRRFVKRESLPAEKQGIYFDSDYDLEKLMDEDIVDRHEILEEMKRDVEVKKRKMEESTRPPATPAPIPDPAPVVPPSGPPPA